MWIHLAVYSWPQNHAFWYMNTSCLQHKLANSSGLDVARRQCPVYITLLLMQLLNEDLYGSDGICTICCAQEERTQSVCSVWQHWNICCCHCDIKGPPPRRTVSFIRPDTLSMPDSVINLNNQLAAQGLQLQLIPSNTGPTSSSNHDSRHQLNSRQESEVIIRSEMIRRQPGDTSRQFRTSQTLGRGWDTGLASTRPFQPILPAIRSNATTVEDISGMPHGRTRHGSLIPQAHDDMLRQQHQSRRHQSIS
ncbi:hypothetical protein ACJMK2_012452 [Sinanodonta woodiana]|uniref:Uncharacterized protein n=1 Tax=Sinanodonta woodiana TaxID=1069815 RepID=A0ABD3V881_SINWO